MARKKNSRSPSNKIYYTEYKARGVYAKNKEAKLKRHLKKYPNDSQAEKALEGPISFKRKKPYNKVPETQVIAKKNKNGKVSYRVVLTRPQKLKAKTYENGLPVIDETAKHKSAMRIAIEESNIARH